MDQAILQNCKTRQTADALGDLRLLLHPVEAEIAGARFMRAVGIGTAPEVRLVSAGERLDPRAWVAKAIVGDRLKLASADFTGSRVAVRKIPGAIPLSWLRSRYHIAAPMPRRVPEPALAAADPVGAVLLKEFALFDGLNISWMTSRRFSACVLAGRRRYTDNEPLSGELAFMIALAGLWRGKEELPNATEFFADFRPPEDWRKIRAAIRLDSDGMLRIHAARLFLGCSTAHASNVLIDGDAKLYSIDHERLYSTDGEEIDLLFESVRPGTRAFAALQPVAQLTLARVREVFPPALVPHYGARLERWQRGCYGSRSAPKTFQFSK